MEERMVHGFAPQEIKSRLFRDFAGGAALFFYALETSGT